MFHRIQQYPLIRHGGGTYRPRVYGAPQPDGSWDGWIVFFPVDGSRALATNRETTQSTLESLSTWAAGLTPVYLMGALERALRLVAAPQVLAHLAETEYEALKDAESLETAAEIERETAKIDEAAAAAARADAESIRRERHRTQSALAAAEQVTAETEANLHERAAREARSVARDAAQRRRKARAESAGRTGSRGRKKK